MRTAEAGARAIGGMVHHRDTYSVVADEDGRIVGYAAPVAFFGHTVAKITDDVIALIAAAPAYGGLGFLVPSRNGALMRWRLAKGLRLVQPMTLMTMGFYSEPQGAWSPSVL